MLSVSRRARPNLPRRLAFPARTALAGSDMRRLRRKDASRPDSWARRGDELPLGVTSCPRAGGPGQSHHSEYSVIRTYARYTTSIRLFRARKRFEENHRETRSPWEAALSDRRRPDESQPGPRAGAAGLRPSSPAQPPPPHPGPTALTAGRMPRDRSPALHTVRPSPGTIPTPSRRNGPKGGPGGSGRPGRSRRGRAAFPHEPNTRFDTFRSGTVTG